VRNYAALRTDRAAEITGEIGGGLPLLGAVCGLSPSRHPATLELLNIATNVTKLVEFRMKHALACRRPNEYSPQIQPMIQTPSHGALPSGHAAETFVSAILLDRLINAGKSGPDGFGAMDLGNPMTVQLLRHAERVAINRTVAGVHFPVDSAAGLILARTLAEFYIARFSGVSSVHSRTFDGTGFKGDFSYDAIWARSDKKSTPKHPEKICRSDKEIAVHKSDLLYHLWCDAAAEWAPRDGHRRGKRGGA
jgi:PAP2 superfamily